MLICFDELCRKKGRKMSTYQIDWTRYPNICNHEGAKQYLQFEADRRLAPNTIQTYAYKLDKFLEYCAEMNIDVYQATTLHIVQFIKYLSDQPLPRNVSPRSGKTEGFETSTIRLYLTVIRMFYDREIYQERIKRNPVPLGEYSHQYPAMGKRGLLPSESKVAWIPNTQEWNRIIDVVSTKPIRTRVMFLLQYECALRREELCNLTAGDIDTALKQIRVTAENSKNNLARTIPFSEDAATLYTRYSWFRGSIIHELRKNGKPKSKSLFISESNRNRGKGIGGSAWSKEIKQIAIDAGVPQFTSHTLRHLRLTDLARCDWDVHEIAEFAGHKSAQTTIEYIRLSARDLAKKLPSTMIYLNDRLSALGRLSNE
jgi:integrase/recombinase XerD